MPLVGYALKGGSRLIARLAGKPAVEAPYVSACGGGSARKLTHAAKTSGISGCSASLSTSTERKALLCDDAYQGDAPPPYTDVLKFEDPKAGSTA